MHNISYLKNRLVIVTNRLPVVLEQAATGRWQTKPGSEGGVAALAPIMRNQGGLWIGWPGIMATEDMNIDGLLRGAVKDSGCTFKPVPLSAKEVAGFCYGFANEILWPLFHDLQSRCYFDPGYWKVYRNVNRKFAKAICRNTGENDHIWIHDYHLIGVGRELRDLGLMSKVAYFLHIPFPPLDLFLKLPWCFQILNALLACDLVGFQTQRDKHNFVQCVRAMSKDDMNLVAKEYCAANVAENGVLILSEFAGAAAQLHADALLVNPYDIEEVAETIAAACDMPLAKRRQRMKALRAKVRKYDTYRWFNSFLNVVFARDQTALPPLKDYITGGIEVGMQARGHDPSWMELV
jgi:trehalose-6-phosphate synthase